MLLEFLAPIGIVFFLSLLKFLSKGNTVQKNHSVYTRKKDETDSKAYTIKQFQKEVSDLSGILHNPEHTHNRLDTDCYKPEEKSEHYTKQADSLYKAGLIDKQEYHSLISHWNHR